VFQVTGVDDYGTPGFTNTRRSRDDSCANGYTDSDANSDHHTFSCANVIKTGGNPHTDSFAKVNADGDASAGSVTSVTFPSSAPPGEAP